MRIPVSGSNQKTLPIESQDPQPHTTHEYNLSKQTTDTIREDTTTSSLYPQIPALNQEKPLCSIEECGMSCYKINTDNHSLDSRERTSTTSTDQPTNQTTTTESHNTVDNRQNPLKKKDPQAYKSETHLYLQSIYWTLPHVTLPRAFMA
jgi:hypothetical protein